METQAGNSIISPQTAAKSKFQSTPFNPKATLLIDIVPAGNTKPAAEGTNESLHQLLMAAESSAQRTQFLVRKWQLSEQVRGD